MVATVARKLGLEKVMFEAADPVVFGCYVNDYGPEVNLFVDHSQIVRLECLLRHGGAGPSRRTSCCASARLRITRK